MSLPAEALAEISRAWACMHLGPYHLASAISSCFVVRTWDKRAKCEFGGCGSSVDGIFEGNKEGVGSGVGGGRILWGRLNNSGGVGGCSSRLPDPASRGVWGAACAASSYRAVRALEVWRSHRLHGKKHCGVRQAVFMGLRVPRNTPEGSGCFGKSHWARIGNSFPMEQWCGSAYTD